MKPKKKNKGGRPAKLTPAIINQIGEHIADGTTEEQACMIVGVSFKSFESAKRRKPEYAGVIKKKQAIFVGKALKVIAAGGEYIITGEQRGYLKPWTGLAWILERRHKAQFCRYEAKALTPDGEGAILTQEQINDLGKIARELYVKPKQVKT